MTDPIHVRLRQKAKLMEDEGFITAARTIREAADLLDPETSAMGAIEAERRRQIEQEGWTPEHDDAHFAGEMARAAAAYAVKGSMPDGRDFQVDVAGQSFHGQHHAFRIGYFFPQHVLWPWDASWWKPSTPRRDLVKAGALIVAEIERLDRKDRT